MPPKGTRRHHASSQHGPRNETGSASSTRKSDKHGRPKANGVLNGSPSSSTREHAQSNFPRGPPLDDEETELDDDHTEPSPLHPGSRRSTDPLFEELNEGSRQASMSSTGGDFQQPRRIDVNAPGNPAVHIERGRLHLVSRIIRACPLADTLALLMVLLQIPPTVINLIQILYAMGTLVPSLTSIFPSLTWLADFMGGSEGAPSIPTIILADIIMLCIWMFLWTPLQDLMLDLVQAVMAASWGGRSHENDSGIKKTGFASIVMTVVHCARAGRLDWLKSTPPSSGLWSYMSEYVPGHLGYEDYRRGSPSSDHSWVRAFVAVHILAQSLVGMVRRSLTKHEKSSLDGGRRKSVDSSSEHSSAASGGDSADSFSVSTKEGREQISRTKNRKKQSAISRGFAPVWAVVAWSKSLTLNDFEHTQATKEATGAKATDQRNLGNAPFKFEEGRAWVTRIDSTEVFFQTSFFQTFSSDSTDADSSEHSPAVKPFHVRINHATWPSTRMQQLKIVHSNADPTRSQWKVEVFGLTPGSSYVCEFIDNNQDHNIIYSLHVTTPLVSVADSHASSSCLESTGTGSRGVPVHGGSTNATAVPAMSLRPSSPTTALKQSVAVAEQKLEEERGAVKKLRKEHKSLVAGLKKEIDGLNSRSNTSGSGDDRNRQRLTQISQHIRQAEDAAATMVSQTEEMKVVPEEDLSEWKETKERWEAVREQYSEAQGDLADNHSNLDRQKSSVQSEALTVQQKRERVQARQTKLSDQHHRLREPSEGPKTDENALKQTPPPPDHLERTTLIEQYTGQVRQLQHTYQEIQLSGQHIWQQVRMIESAYNDQQQQQQQQQSMMLPANKTPEGVFAGNYTTIHNPATPRFANLTLPTSTPASVSTTYTPMSLSRSGPGSGLGPHEGRLRSSSMRSNRSGLNDYVEGAIQAREAAALGVAAGAVAAANGSDVTTYRDMVRGGVDGSGTGSGTAHGRSRSGSQRDPASPLPRTPHMQQYAGGKGSSPVWQ